MFYVLIWEEQLVLKHMCKNPCWENSRTCLVFPPKHEGYLFFILVSFLVPEQCETYILKVKCPVKCDLCCQFPVSLRLSWEVSSDGALQEKYPQNFPKQLTAVNIVSGSELTCTVTRNCLSLCTLIVTSMLFHVHKIKQLKVN